MKGAGVTPAPCLYFFERMFSPPYTFNLKSVWEFFILYQSPFLLDSVENRIKDDLLL